MQEEQKSSALNVSFEEKHLHKDSFDNITVANDLRCWKQSTPQFQNGNYFKLFNFNLKDISINFIWEKAEHSGSSSASERLSQFWYFSLYKIYNTKGCITIFFFIT